MQPYSIDLRARVVSAIAHGDGSFRAVAQRFCVSKNCVEQWVTQQRTQGHVMPRKQGGSVSAVMEHQDQLMAIVEPQTDATLAEDCELLFDATGLWVSQNPVAHIPATSFTTPQKTLRASQARSERVQRLRAEYWVQVKGIDLKD